MSTHHNGQVQLAKLIFTHNWEDPVTDEKVLCVKPGQRLFTITSGGCNALGFLRFDPASIVCVDINEAQTFLMELKKAAIRNLEYDQFLSFLGVRKSDNRLVTFKLLEGDLSAAARGFWQKNQRTIAKGIIMNGRYERFVKIAGRLLRLVQGNKKTKRLFACNNLAEQKKFYDNQWNNSRWKWIFNTMFNKRRLARKGLNADYFHFDDGSASFSESFQRRAAHAISELPIEGNYFLSLYLLGCYQNESCLPPYLIESHYPSIKKNIDRIHTVTADSKYWLQQQPADLFDGFSLSNICELMNDEDTYKLFEQVIRTAKSGANVVFRNLIIPREVPDMLKPALAKDVGLSQDIQFNDRSFVYGKIAAYSVLK